MARMTLFPVGNGDTIILEYADGRMMLVDYCDQKDPEDKKDKRIDLPAAIRKMLRAKRRDKFDVVAFTHAHADHVAKAEEFFWLEHDKSYQSEGKIRIEELWVPALFILEPGLEGSALAVQKEARHRLKDRKGVRVFSSPGQLDAWLKKAGIPPESVKDLITHAGQVVPRFTKESGGAEVFVHSPFSFRLDEDTEDRNDNSLVLHVSFFDGDKVCRVFLGADAEHKAWADIVTITEFKKRKERLDWNIFKIAHHCSHTALAPDAGEKVTEPVAEVKRLFSRGASGCRLISSSNPVDGKETPPHKEAAAYYEKVAKDKKGAFEVTMESPSKEEPAPIIIDVSAAAEPSKAYYGAMSADQSSAWRKAAEKDDLAASAAAPQVVVASGAGKPAVLTRPWFMRQ